MKGHDEVIAKLNQLLAGELTAIDQYFIHGRLCHEWGFHKLGEHFEHERQEEQSHADRLIERILFLEGEPAMSERQPLHTGKTVEEMLSNDLALENSVITTLREAMGLCEKLQDYQTRDILLDLLRDTEEDHTHWLETQLGLIARIGLQYYLQSQI